MAWSIRRTIGRHQRRRWSSNDGTHAFPSMPRSTICRQRLIGLSVLEARQSFRRAKYWVPKLALFADPAGNVTGLLASRNDKSQIANKFARFTTENKERSRKKSSHEEARSSRRRIKGGQDCSLLGRKPSSKP